MNEKIKGFSFENFLVEYESGKMIKISDAENIETETSSNKKTISADIDSYKIRIFCEEIEKNIFSVKATLTPCGNVNDKVHKIITLNISSPYTDKTRILINHNFKEGIIPVKDLPEDCRCRDFCSFYDIDNPHNALTLTTKLPCKFKSDIKITKDEKTFSIEASTTLPYSFEGEVICQEWIVYTGMSIDNALIKNADRYCSEKALDTPVGWSTWDYYFTSATEDDVKENVDFIANDEFLSEKVRYIALDDGWQQREGDWKSGIRYPGGLKATVDYIREKGFEAGIWIAPTRLHFLCGTVMRRNSFLVRDEYGDPVKDDDMYILDPTHPDGEQFLRETFSYLADCGFTFYKLDFISNILTLSERFYDKSAGPFDVLKKLFDLVREIVPEGSHIMGCSLPYGMGGNVADSRRTGWDIHNTWGHIKVCTATYIPQFAANGKIFRNDLDYLVVRGKDTSCSDTTNVLNPTEGYNKAYPDKNFVWRAGEDFDYEEAKTWCNIMLMSGSSIFMGDRLSTLNNKGLNLIKTTLSEADFTAATPVFDDGVIPSVWYKKDLGKLYIFNFTDDEKSFNISFEETGVSAGTYRDVFSQEEFSSNNGVLSLKLESHQSVCLRHTTSA